MKTETLIENSLQVVTFRVGNEDYGLHIMRVQEIIRVIEAVKVPKAPKAKPPPLFAGSFWDRI